MAAAPKKTASKAQKYDVVVYGATSFVGQILASYLLQRHGVGGDLNWAIAGRSASKLAMLKSELGASDLPEIIADSADRSALTAMAKQAKVICSTVGPYALYGSELVGVCAELGTDYCDLTGEPQWMREMVDQHGAAAKKSGARIVHNCGFDSLPSDLGVWYTQQQAKKSFGETCKQIRLRVKAMRGGASGGTVASMLNVVKLAAKDPALRKILQNPYAVCPEGMRKGIRQPNVNAPEYDEVAKSWLAPFIMASINTRVVHRSNALQGHAWGKDFVYDEAMSMGDGAKGRLKASGLAAGLGGFVGLAAIAPARAFMAKYVLPAPGEGPTPQEQRDGFYDIRLFGTLPDGQIIKTKVTGDQDPGYGSTAKMLGEAAVCLAKDVGVKKGAGFPTPSVIFGDKLIKRLEAHAGLSFSVL